MLGNFNKTCLTVAGLLLVNYVDFTTITDDLKRTSNVFQSKVNYLIRSALCAYMQGKKVFNRNN